MILIKALFPEKYKLATRLALYSLLAISIAASVIFFRKIDQNQLRAGNINDLTNIDSSNRIATDNIGSYDLPAENTNQSVSSGNSSSIPGRSKLVPGNVSSDPTSPANNSPSTGNQPGSAAPSVPQDKALTATIAFYADNQSDSDVEDENHRRVINYILASGANPVFHAGDLMEDGTQASLDRFNNIAGTLLSSRTFYGALGNNDRKVGDSSTPSSLYLNNFNFPGNERWYSVNVGSLHLVVLDSAFSSASVDQINWLRSDLQSEAARSRMTGVMFHHPTFASNINQYLMEYGVDFVVSGHNHIYSHTTNQGIHYLVTSDQPSIGYFILKVYSNKSVLYAYNSSNILSETVIIQNR